jgi:hypothetical protein
MEPWTFARGICRTTCKGLLEKKLWKDPVVEVEASVRLVATVVWDSATMRRAFPTSGMAKVKERAKIHEYEFKVLHLLVVLVY